MSKKIHRGKPSSIDLIPEDLRIRLVSALKDKRLTQKEILETFNELLESRGESILSRSSLNRYAHHVEEKNAMLKDAREAATAIVGKLGESQNDLGRALIEVSQGMALDLTLNGKLTVDELNKLALLAQRLESAGKIGLERELKIREIFIQEQKEKLNTAVNTGLIKREAAEEARQILGFV